MSVLQDLERLVLPSSVLRAHGCRTASLAILEDGKISAHVITDGTEDVDTVYQVCSISKAITALAVAKLVDQGQLTYDTKLIDHLDKNLLDSIVEPQAEQLGGLITIAMLLSHTAGLSQGGFPGYPGDLPTATDIITGQRPSNTPRLFLRSIPGSQCEYSGGGFVLLQLMLERITGKPFPELMQDIVLAPLEMKRSWYGDPPNSESNFAKANYTGQTPTETPYHRFIELAAAGLWSTPSDLLRAVSAIQESLASSSGFLSQETAKRMLQPIGSNPQLKEMASGWALGEASFGHAGSNNPGYCSYVFGFTTARNGANSLRGDEMSRCGISITINSPYTDFTMIKQTIGAISYLKGWINGGDLPKLRGDDFAPLPLLTSPTIDEKWKYWVGFWGTQWELSDQGGPVLIYRGSASVRLRAAATPAHVFDEDRKEIQLVADGVQSGVRLTWEGEVKVLQLLGTFPKTLRRSNGSTNVD